MKRRRLVIMAGTVALGVPSSPLAQPSGQVYRIGVLSEIFPRLRMLGGLRALGYEEGRNLVVDFKFAQGKPELLPGLAAELVASKPDLIVAPLNTDVAALKKVTSTIPIVMMYVSAPVELGLVASLAHPGGNITGTTTNAPEMAGKMTQVLREAIPRLSRITWLSDPDYPGMPLYIKWTEEAASAMGLRLNTLAVRTQSDLDLAFTSIARDRPDGLAFAMTGAIRLNQARIIEFTSRLKIPALYSTREPVLGGGLMSYGPDFGAIDRRDAWMIDKILKGAKPSEIPVEEPSKFLLSINMKTARAMGLAIPQGLLMQASEVIE